MIKRGIRIWVLFFVLAFIAGCATTSDVIKSKQNGQSNVYSINPDQAWEIARTVFQWANSDAIEEHRKEGYLVATSGANVMGAWIETVDKKSTRVTVVSKRRILVNPLTDLSEKSFHNYFSQGVKIVKSGKRLPSSPPKK
jgi:hypothetical protein